MSVTPKEYQEAVKKAMESLDDIFEGHDTKIQIEVRAVILRLLHDIGFQNIKND